MYNSFMDKDWLHQMRMCSRVVRDEDTAYLKRHCTGKFRHKSEESANKEASRMSKKRRDINFESYACEFCGTWHIGREKK